MNKTQTVLDTIKNSVKQTLSLTGGSTCHTQLLKTAKGKAYVFKQLNDTPRNFFIREQAGLETLTITGIFKTPTVYAADQHGILLQYIDTIRPTNKHWYQLGQQLAQLHQITHHTYGFNEDNFIGSIPQKNTWQNDWPSFYREQRLLPLIRHPLFNHDDLQRWEKLLTRLDNFLDNSEPPALLHGDLWNTNILFTNDDIYLIDPAVYYGSREIEIAYLEFVGDLHRPLVEAYQADYPLAKDYAERKNLYLLYPYLVHLHLFGKAYLPGIRQVLHYYT